MLQSADSRRLLPFTGGFGESQTILSAGMKFDLQKQTYFTELGLAHYYAVENEDNLDGPLDEDSDLRRCAQLGVNTNGTFKMAWETALGRNLRMTLSTQTNLKKDVKKDLSWTPFNVGVALTAYL